MFDSQGGWRALEVREGPEPDEIISDEDRLDDLADGESVVGQTSWSIDVDVRTDKERLKQQIIGTANRIRLPGTLDEGRSFWVAAGASVGLEEVRLLSELKKTGRDGELVELLREVDPRLSGIELLAPRGSTAELFVRLDNGTPLLPLSLMGEGFQRCLEIGAIAAADHWPALFIDEVENGMHHLALEPFWRWIGIVSQRRNLQVFATTHSEECIHAACRAFSGLEDAGLRVIRLDRLESGTRAVIYDRTLLEIAARTDTEIRG